MPSLIFTINFFSFPDVCRGKNDEVVPCYDNMDGLFAFFVVMPTLGMLAIFFVIFWLWMLIDAIKNQKENKFMWILLILLLNALGAIVYYLSQKRKRAKLA